MDQMDKTQLNAGNVDSSETIRRVLRVCKKGRWLIALCTVLGVVGGNVVARLVPPKYRSEATILFAEQNFSPYIVTPLSTTPLVDRLQLAAREVLSHSRLLEIFVESGLITRDDPSADDTVELQQKNIDIEPNPPAFRISFTAKTPQLAQSVTKGLTDLFIERHSQLQANEVQTATSLIQEQLAHRRNQLSELDQRMEAFKAQYAGELTDEQPDSLADLSQAKSKLESLTAGRERAIQQRAILESLLVGNLNARRTRLEDERAVLLKTLTTKHPDVVSKDKQIAQVEAEMEEIKAGAGTLQSRQSPLASVDPSIAQLEGQLQANALEIDSLSKDETRQNDIIAANQRRITKNPVHEQQLNTMALQRQVLNDEIAELAQTQQKSGLAADMAAREEGQEFRLVDPASLPTHPSSKKRQQASLAGLAVGPLLGFALAFLLELRRPTFQTENELRRTFAPPLVLSIPLLPTRREKRIRTWRTALELFAGCVVAIVMAAYEFYAYRLLS